MPNPIHTINPDTAQQPVCDLYDNGLWKFCEDDPMSNDATYDKFELGPDYILRAGTTVQIGNLWGWDRDDIMTPMLDWQITLPKAKTVKEVIAIILHHYHQEITTGRFYFIEQVSIRDDGIVEVFTGT